MNYEQLVNQVNYEQLVNQAVAAAQSAQQYAKQATEQRQAVEALVVNINQQQIAQLNTIKQDIKQALINKGQQPTDSFADYAQLINSIEVPYGVLIEGTDGQLLFQQLQLQGDVVTTKGQPRSVQGYYVYQTGVQQPQYEGAVMIPVITEITDGVIPFKHNTVVQYQVNADDVLSINTQELKSGQCATMELWLVMDQIVSFSLNDVVWVKQPQFDTANTTYTIVLRWNGSQVIANIAYKREQA